MYRLIACLLALVGVSLGAVWAMLLREQKSPVSPARVVESLPEPAHPATAPTGAPLAPPRDAAEIGGYSGTAMLRAPVPGARQAAPNVPPMPPRGRIKATDEQLPGIALAMSRAAAYEHALELMYQAGQGWTLVPMKDPPEGYSYGRFETRFQREPDKMASVLFNAFEKATGVARQNIIFQAALALPERICLPWLNGLRAGPDAEDAEDALCALAFRGDEDAMTAFESLALTQAPENWRVIADTAGDHDKLAAEGRRGLLRSYRCIEMLDCKPYFWKHSWSYGRGVGMRFPWADEYARGSAPQRADIARRLLPHWIRRFDGHPGSDDMAYRLCGYCQSRNDWLEAARWASRCATFPDQDMWHCGVEALLMLAELHLERWQIDALIVGQDHERNRTLLQYIRLRRAAAFAGFDAAVREAAVIAGSERNGKLGRAYFARWSMAPARGLDSGVKTLPMDDPLRELEPGVETDVEPANPVRHRPRWKIIASTERSLDVHRMNPPLEAVSMPSDRLARQFRLWETMAELERRRDTARGDDRADLDYKLAAVYYHERDVVFPCYARHDYNSGLPRHWGGHEDIPFPDESASIHNYCHGFSSGVRAVELFARLADQCVNWQGRDKALFSAGMACIKLADYRPVGGRDNHLRAGVAHFERMAREHPQSNLADDASRAADYWRRARKDLWA